MASPSRPPFSLAKVFIQPAQACKSVPIDVVNRAHEIADKKVDRSSRQRDESDDPVSWETLARILAFKARKEPANYRDAYLDDDAINRFLQAICRDVNRKAHQRLLAASTIDLEACSVRAVAFDPVGWSGPANRLLKNEISTEEMGEYFKKSLRRKGVHSRPDFLGLDYVFLPRCRQNHWTLNVIWPRSKQFATLNSATADAPYMGFIDHFVHPFLQGLLGDLYDPRQWLDASDTARPAESSQQHNPTDCGAALCLCAVAIAAGRIPSCGDLRIMERLRQAIAGTLVLGGFEPGFWEI